MALTAEDFEFFLKFDQWDTNQFVCLITDTRPGTGMYRTEEYDYQPEQMRIHDIAKASIKAGKIKEKSKDVSDFAVSPKEWIEWAIRKDLSLPKALEEAYQVYEPEEGKEQRPKELYRPREEFVDRITIVSLIEIISDIFPELPIDKLVKLEPIQKHARGRYKNATLVEWAKGLGLQNKPGRRSEELKETCLQKIPKKWKLVWD